MINILEVIVLVGLAGFFDYIMDMIKDYKQSPKNWLYTKTNGTIYAGWYLNPECLPFLAKRGYNYNPGNIFLSDAWHMAKHLMMLSFAGAIACAFGTYWFLQIPIWWLVYYVEGEIFIRGYESLKEVK